MHACMVKTQWSKAVVKGERATFKGKADCQRPTLEVARSRSSGGGWAPSGWASPWEPSCPDPPGRHTLRRCKSRAEAPPMLRGT